MNRIAVVVTLAASLAASAAMAGEASACSILPPAMPPQLVMIPNEAPAEYEARAKLHMDGFNALQEKKQRDNTRAYQDQLWETAGAVAVAEVVSNLRDQPIGAPGQVFGSGNVVEVKLTSWLKGKGRKGAVMKLAHTSATSCGPTPMWRVLYGAPGERFVMFFETGALKQDDVREGVPVGDIAAPEIFAALAARAR